MAARIGKTRFVVVVFCVSMVRARQGPPDVKAAYRVFIPLQLIRQTRRQCGGPCLISSQCAAALSWVASDTPPRGLGNERRGFDPVYMQRPKRPAT